MSKNQTIDLLTKVAEGGKHKTKNKQIKSMSKFGALLGKKKHMINYKKVLRIRIGKKDGLS